MKTILIALAPSVLIALTLFYVVPRKGRIRDQEKLDEAMRNMPDSRGDRGARK